MLEAVLKYNGILPTVSAWREWNSRKAVLQAQAAVIYTGVGTAWVWGVWTKHRAAYMEQSNSSWQEETG